MFINKNGEILSDEGSSALIDNRAFKYGDGLFDTLKFTDGHVHFAEEHYFRLVSSMRMLRMKIPQGFTLEVYIEHIVKTVECNGLQKGARIRVNVFRSGGGLYTPDNNASEFIIEVASLSERNYNEYEIELFKDFYVTSGLLSTIKTNNRMINVLASIYAKENDYQNVLLINEKKELVEAANSNVFIVKGRELITPSLDSGCINGIIRKKVLEVAQKNLELTTSETQVSPFELLKADEVFLSNSINEFQKVNRYRKKTYASGVTDEIIGIFETTQW